MSVSHMSEMSIYITKRKPSLEFKSLVFGFTKAIQLNISAEKPWTQ